MDGRNAAPPASSRSNTLLCDPLNDRTGRDAGSNPRIAAGARIWVRAATRATGALRSSNVRSKPCDL